MERKLLYLSRGDVEGIALPMTEIIEAVSSALSEKARGRAEMPPKHWLAPSEERFFSAMTSVLPAVSAAACKWQSGSPGNHRHGLPYITGLLILNDLATGAVLAVMDSTWLTERRTAAATAVAARHLARPGARNMAVLGCGLQGRANLDAVRTVLPGIDRVLAYDIAPAALRRYAEEVAAQHGVEVVECGGPREAIDGADIVVTCGPIRAAGNRMIEPGWLKPGGLAVTLDYDCYWTASGLAAADLLYSDDLGQIRHMQDYGYFAGLDRPIGELGEVVAGLRRGRQSPAETIVSINMGIALEDVATARRIYDRATSRGTGMWLPW
jgi:ornithine cyclodeaminase/alanine dehydrogenase